MGQKLGEEIILRPRFKIELDAPMEQILSKFERVSKSQNDFIVTRVDAHVFLKIPKKKQHYWSPQLDLECFSFKEGHCTLQGLFGPKPAVWTLFMFLHFLVGILFLSFAVWGYSNYSLNTPYAVQLVLTGLMVIAWFVLYAAGRMGKAAGKQEMYLLYHFMQNTLKS